MSNRPILSLALLALAFAGACAGAPKGPASADEVTSAQQSTSAGRNRDIITQSEISAPGLAAQNVYEAIRQLRPQYLTERGGQSTTNPQAGKVHASIDGQRVLGIDELRTLMVSNVIEVRFLNAAAAMQKFGMAAMQGPVIVVRTTM